MKKINNTPDPTQTTLKHSMFPLVSRKAMHEHGPNVLMSGDGLYVTDQYGKTFLDMMSMTTRAGSLGYGNKEVAQAMYGAEGRAEDAAWVHRSRDGYFDEKAHLGSPPG